MQQDWIDLKERTPEDREEVIVTDGVFVVADVWDAEVGEFENAHDSITHWMPYPVPPRRMIRKKILPEYFEKVKSGEKNFELRKDEDRIEPGNVILLEEWDGQGYTGRTEMRIVTYVMRDASEYGLKEGYVIIGW